MPLKKNNSTPLTFKIGKIWNSAEGTTVKLKLDVPLQLTGSGLNPATNLAGELLVIKLKEELSVIVSETNVSLHMNCSRCLEPFIQLINIPGAEREFLANKPAKIEDPADLFLIDLNEMTIDLSEMIRQEIILHFPLIPVCSEGCKGLCQHCGGNRNKSICKCKSENFVQNKPFKNLKTILKQTS